MSLFFRHSEIICASQQALRRANNLPGFIGECLSSASLIPVVYFVFRQDFRILLVQATVVAGMPNGFLRVTSISLDSILSAARQSDRGRCRIWWLASWLSLLIKLQKGRLTALVHGSFSGRGVGDRQLNNRSVTLMPFEHNAARCHRIGRMKFKVTNWPEYEAGLRRRGSLTLWLTPEARAMWLAPRRTTRGGQPRYSDLVSRPVLD